MLQLIQVFLSEKWQVTYASTAINKKNAFDLSNLGIDSVSIELNNSNFDNFIVGLQPDIVLFDRFIVEEQFGWRVSETIPNAVKILDTEDLHCLRNAREIALKNNTKFIVKDILKNDVAKREIASILRCDLSLIISTFEMEILKKTAKIDENLLHYVPFLFEPITDKQINSLPNLDNRNHFYFIGNFLHKPNYDAVLYLKTHIWPEISKQIPKAELHIYGAYPSQKVTQLNNKKERFFIKGKLNDLSCLKQYKICLSPLRFGAGIKGKLSEAMQNGTPSITTTIGSEGMHANLPWNGFVKNEATEISDAAINLYTNQKLWKELQTNGFSIINKLYNKKHHSALLIDRLYGLEKNLSKHREANFIGEILQHHTLKSTKYLSKWIEEKNKV